MEAYLLRFNQCLLLHYQKASYKMINFDLSKSKLAGKFLKLIIYRTLSDNNKRISDYKIHNLRVANSQESLVLR